MLVAIWPVLAIYVAVAACRAPSWCGARWGSVITSRDGRWWWVADMDKRLAVLGPHVHEGGCRWTVLPLLRGLPVRTARRWLRAYEADGAAGLARVSRSDRGSHRVSAEVRALIEGLALRRPPPRMAEVHRAVVETAEEKS